MKQTAGVENPQPPHFKKEGIFIPFDATTAVRHVEGDLFRFTISKQERIFLRDAKGIEADFLYLHLPRFHELANIKEITLYPVGRSLWTARAVYEVVEPELNADNGRYLSIDLGVRNFATCYASHNGETFILGKRFIELNHFYNKQVANLNSIFAKQQVAAGCTTKPKESKRVRALGKQYRNGISNLLHQASAYIRSYCLANHINTVVIGDITGIRDGNSLGKQANQPFHTLPYLAFEQKLSYKLRLCGINLVKQKEFYSSQCSPFSPKVSREYAKKKNRKCRGLYVDGNYVFNADAVGACNILRLFLADKHSDTPIIPFSATYKVSA